MVPEGVKSNGERRSGYASKEIEKLRMREQWMAREVKTREVNVDKHERIVKKKR